MRSKTIYFIFLFFILYSGICFSEQNYPEYVEGEILVKFKSGVAEVSKQNLHIVAGTRVIGEFVNIDVQRLKLPEGTKVKEAIKMYEGSEVIEYVQPNYIYHICSRTPNDTFFEELWGLNNTGQSVNGVPSTSDADIDAPEAWDLNTGSGNVVVAVIDTGINLAHEDLEGNLWSDSGGFHGYDYVNDNKNPDDDHGHGSHVAGIIGAKGDNFKGVTGVTWDVKLMALKSFNAAGLGTTADIISAINYAKDNGADIVNCSFTNSSFDQLTKDAIDDASELLFVCAAGNGGNDGIGDGWDVDVFGQEIYPACYDSDNVIAIAATDQDDNLPAYSNYGETSVDVAAPGGDNSTNNIYSCDWGSIIDYAYNAGTSMAAPYVSGLAALMLSRNSGLSVSDLKTKIINGVDVLSSLTAKVASGGRINAYSSLSSVSAGGGGDDGNGSKGDGTSFSDICFIATIVYKNSDSWQVKKLCEFRDEYLVDNSAGRKLVDFYYRIGPSMAEFIKNRPLLKKHVKWNLDTFLYFYSKFKDKQ